MSPRQKEPLTYEHALLGFLSKTPMHAYALHQMVGQSPLGVVWRVKQSALYAMLSRLASERFIAVAEEDRNARGKRLLTLTATGATAFAQWCVTPVPHPRDMRMEFLAKLFFLVQSPADVRQQLIRAQQLQALQWYEPPDTQISPYAQTVRQFRNGQITAIQTWLTTLDETV